ncbi:MAG: FAD:protein FMN transferase [Alistipes sp.]|nr:FAD:protein FMN transferase [Alistipes sp.]
MLSSIRTTILLTTTILLSTLMCGCGERSRYIEIQGEALGTFVQVKCNTSLPTETISNIIQEVDRESKNSMSIFSPMSLLSRINRNETDSLDSHITRNIELAHRFSVISDGAYDITIKPLTDALGFGKEEAQNSVNVDSLLEFVGYELLAIEDGRLRKADSRVEIDLNSIAKGYTVDLIAERLEALQIADYMVNIGGEIRCRGINAKGERWSIAIETPYDGNMAMDSFEKIVRIADKAVATSGNYRRYYLTESGEKVAHTIDPKSGCSAVSTLLSATVIAPTCAEADAAATMFMSLGATNSAESVAEQCHRDYGWDYYFIFAGEEDYRVVCSEGLVSN